MNIKDIYDTVKLQVSCSQNDFLTYLDQSVRTLISRFKEPYVVEKGGKYGKPATVNTDIPIYEEYYPAVLNNILFLLTGNSDRKTDSTAEAEYAYRSVWSKKSRGKRFVARGYYDV